VTIIREYARHSSRRLQWSGCSSCLKIGRVSAKCRLVASLFDVSASSLTIYYSVSDTALQSETYPDATRQTQCGPYDMIRELCTNARTHAFLAVPSVKLIEFWSSNVYAEVQNTTAHANICRNIDNICLTGCRHWITIRRRRSAENAQC